MLWVVGSVVVCESDEDGEDVDAPAQRWLVLRGQQAIPIGRQLNQAAVDRGAIELIVFEGGGQRFLIEDQGTSDEEARKRFQSQLEFQVQSMTRSYSLSDAQRKKLQLAGKGDIHQHFVRLAEIRSLSNSTATQPERLAVLFAENQNALRAGFFCDESLFQKTLRTMLTDEQRVRYRSIGLEKQRRILESVMLDWDRAADRFKLWGEPRKKFIELLVPHLNVPASAGAYSHQIVFLEAWRLREQVQPLLTAAEWKLFEWQVERAKELIPTLEARGLWTEQRPNMDDDATEVTTK